MGYRLTFYKAPIEYIEEVSNWSDEDYDNGGYEELDENLEEVLYNCTNWLHFDEFTELCRNAQEEKIWSKLFKNKLQVEYDCGHNTMNKEQFVEFMHMIRRQILKNYDSVAINHNDLIEFGNNYNPKVGEIKFSLEKKYPAGIGYDSKDLNILEKMYENQMTILNVYGSFRHIDLSEDSFNQLLDNKWKVNSIDSWEHILSNLVYLYRTIDWSTDKIVIIGG